MYALIDTSKNGIGPDDADVAGVHPLQGETEE